MPLDQADYQIETKPDTFSPQSLLAWIERQPANAAYCWSDMGLCLFAQYGKHIFGAAHDPYDLVMKGFGKTSLGCQIIGTVAVERPHTFGAAAKRLRDILASRS